MVDGLRNANGESISLKIQLGGQGLRWCGNAAWCRRERREPPSAPVFLHASEIPAVARKTASKARLTMVYLLKGHFMAGHWRFVQLG